MTEFRETAQPGGTPDDGGLGWDDGLGLGGETGYDHGQGYGPPPPRGRGLDLSFLFVILDALRGSLPRNLQEQFTTLVREMLLTLRALIDWYLERLDRPRRGPKVEDIPID
jgi:hypothetical protein